MSVSKILLIDDDPDFTDGMSLALDLEGYEVTVASTATDGIEASKKTAFDVILSDIGLPDLNGVEALIQAQQFNSDARCFLLTGYSANDIVEQGINAGALKVFTKPVRMEELVELLADTVA